MKRTATIIAVIAASTLMFLPAARAELLDYLEFDDATATTIGQAANDGTGNLSLSTQFTFGTFGDAQATQDEFSTEVGSGIAVYYPDLDADAYRAAEFSSTITSGQIYLRVDLSEWFYLDDKGGTQSYLIGFRSSTNVNFFIGLRAVDVTAPLKDSVRFIVEDDTGSASIIHNNLALQNSTGAESIQAILCLDLDASTWTVWTNYNDSEITQQASGSLTALTDVARLRFHAINNVNEDPDTTTVPSKAKDYFGIERLAVSTNLDDVFSLPSLAGAANAIDRFEFDDDPDTTWRNSANTGDGPKATDYPNNAIYKTDGSGNLVFTPVGDEATRSAVADIGDVDSGVAVLRVEFSGWSFANDDDNDFFSIGFRDTDSDDTFVELAAFNFSDPDDTHRLRYILKEDNTQQSAGVIGSDLQQTDTDGLGVILVIDQDNKKFSVWTDPGLTGAYSKAITDTDLDASFGTIDSIVTRVSGFNTGESVSIDRVIYARNLLALGNLDGAVTDLGGENLLGQPIVTTDGGNVTLTFGIQTTTNLENDFTKVLSFTVDDSEAGNGEVSITFPSSDPALFIRLFEGQTAP